MNKTGIEWADHTWNPITGCTPVSEACAHCYAKATHERFFDGPFSRVRFHRERLLQPLRKKRGRVVFAGSMTDLFHKDVEESWLWEIMGVIAHAPQHLFLILTKRPERMRDFFRRYYDECYRRGDAWCIERGIHSDGTHQNLWLGVTAENQARADERVPLLLETPATKHFVSAEPLLGPLTLRPYQKAAATTLSAPLRVEWVIVGGESGPSARATDPEWVASLHEECRLDGVDFFFKRWGVHSPAGKWYDFEETKERPER